MEVLLEVDEPGGLLTGGYDAVNRHVVSHDEVDQQDWNSLVDLGQPDCRPGSGGAMAPR